MGLLERVPGRVLVLVLVPLLIFCLICCVHHLPSTGLRGSLRLQLRSDVPHRARKRARVEMIAVAEDAERVSESECDTCAHPAALCSAGLPSPSATWCFCRCLPSKLLLQWEQFLCPGAPAQGSWQGPLSAPLSWAGWESAWGGCTGVERGRLGVPQAWPRASGSLAHVVPGTISALPVLVSPAPSRSVPGKASCICAHRLPHAPSHHPLFMGQLFPFREK